MSNLKKQGKFISLEINEENDLVLTLNTDVNVDGIKSEYEKDNLDPHVAFTALAGDILDSDEIRVIPQEKVGGLLEGIIIGTDVSFDENGDLKETDDSNYYCYPDQENTDPVELLLAGQPVTFVVAE